jgi:hypothetical protein
MKKTLTTITLAAILGLGSTFANAEAGIIVAGSPMAQPSKCDVQKDGIIVAGSALASALFGIIVAGNPMADQCTNETDGIIVAG